jgi:DNA-directed RNA polymerase specialized sigma subunit
MTKSKVCPRCNKVFITEKKGIHCSKECQSITQSIRNRMFSDDQIGTILILYYDEEMTGKEIAKIYGVSPSTIYHILSKRRYK